MKLKLTGYKTNAPPHAVRVPVKIRDSDAPNFHRLIGRVLFDSTDKEFDNLVEQLWRFYNDSKCEHQAIYFWLEQENNSPPID